MDWKIPLFKIYSDEADVAAVVETIRRSMFWAIGPNIEKFERMLADYLGVKHAITFNSGTSALHAALLAYGITSGDEVIVPSFTFIATANAPLFVGASPVFADIEEKTFGLDPANVRHRITSKTRAIIPVHYGGGPCMIEELAEVARKNRLLLIEDAAESLGAGVKSRKVGTFGHCAILSFCANKVITTGEGGAIVTDSDEVFQKLKLIRSHGRAETANYFSSNEYMDYVELGYNFRMSDITAALGIAQLGKLNKVIQMRQEKAKRLSARLSRIPGIDTPQPSDQSQHVFQMYTIKVTDGKRDSLMNFLTEKGVMTKVYFSPVHLTHFYRHRPSDETKLPCTEKVSKEVLTLPMYPTMTNEEIDYIAESIDFFFSQ